MTEPAAEGTGQEEGRIRSLEEQDARIDGLSEKIDKILGIVGGAPPSDPGGTAAADPAPDIAAEIRAQLDKRDADARAGAEKDTLHKTVGELAAKVKELSEKPPAEPVKRRWKLMGWM